VFEHLKFGLKHFHTANYFLGLTEFWI